MNPRQLAMKAIEKGAIQKLAELSPLIRLLKRRKLRTIVEIGTATGGTLYAWCQLGEPDAVLVSIDLPGGGFGGGYTLKDTRRFRGYRKTGQKIYFLRKDSHKSATLEELIGILNGRPVDLLMIDGDHTYDGVKSDWLLYSPLVKQNGVIVFHDILNHPQVPECQVNRLWNNIKSAFKFRELIADETDDRGWGPWGGIGIIYYQARKQSAKKI